MDNIQPFDYAAKDDVLAKGAAVEGVDDQKQDDTVRVKTADGKTDGCKFPSQSSSCS